MKYRNFFKNSIPISEIGLGAWQLGENSGWKPMSENEAIIIVEKSLEYGINFFDTAPNYGHGTGEIRLGKALKGKDRKKIVINTKFGHTHTGTLNFNANYIRESLEGSLKRLQTEYIDSFIFHNPPSHYLDGNKNDHYEILEKLVDEGKIKAYGASLDTFKDMEILMKTTNAKVIEAFYNILHQDTAQGFEMAKNKDLGIIAKIPLDSGWLTGKYHENSIFNDIRNRWKPQDIQTRALLIKRIKKIVGPEKNLAQIAIAFCLSSNAVSTVIPGNINLNQLKNNIQSSNIQLPNNLIYELKKLYSDEIKKLNLPW